MNNESRLTHTNFAALKEQYRKAQKALYEIEQASALKSKTKVKQRVHNLYFWGKEEDINQDVWDLIRSELRRIGEEHEVDLIGIFLRLEKKVVGGLNNEREEEVFEKVGAIDWLGEDDV